MEGQNVIDRERRQYDNLLEKVIKITEDNLKAQNEYLHELTLIKNRFDLNDRDHNDVKDQLTHVTNNTFSILNRMNKASNEQILEMLEKTQEFRTDFTHKFNEAEKNIEIISKNCGTCISNLKDIKEATSETKDSFKLIQKLLGGILILATGIQIFSIAWKTVKDTESKKNIQYIIKEELKKKK